jgi:hypothetical protein
LIFPGIAASVAAVLEQGEAMQSHKLVRDPDGMKPMRFTDGGRRQTVTAGWYRGEHCNFGPTLTHLENWQGYGDYFLKGHLPEEPFITPDTRITAFGSCFAVNIGNWLSKRNFRILNKDTASKAYIVQMGEGFVTSYSILQQFQWAFEGKTPKVDLWHGYDAQAFGYDETVRQETLRLLNETDCFILTFGLSEVWYDRPTGEVFWRAIPIEQFDPDRHGFRVVSPEENYLNIKAIVDLIARYRPDAKILMTLSPIPLVATFRPVSCMSANSISKASLRIAIDRLLPEGSLDGRAFYWPSYEIVMDGFLRKWEPDRRHVKRPILDFIMTLFEKAWCKDGVSDANLSNALLRAKVADGSVRTSTYKRLNEMTPSERRDFAHLLTLKKRPRLAETVLAAYD